MEILDAIKQSAGLSFPLLILLVTGLALMMLDAFKQTKTLPWVAALGLIGSAGLALLSREPGDMEIYFGMLEIGGMAPVIHVFLCLAGLFTLFFLRDYLHRQEKPLHDVYALIVFAVLGMILMANARNLLMTFIGLETMSMCLYIFASLFKMDPRSNESGLKYFLLGSFASAFLLFGIALIYGASGFYYMTPEGEAITRSGSLHFDTIAANLRDIQDIYGQGISMKMAEGERSLILLSAMGLMLVGFLFKVAAFPFHNWTPDVYEGAPTPLAGFMATGSKMAAFVALGIIMMKLGFLDQPKVKTLLAGIALITMIYGNIVAARQQNIKRMLAYSSIAHSGYVLLGLCAGLVGFQAAVFYMFIYTLMNIGAFGLVGMAEKDHPDTNLDSWKGIGSKSPYFAGALAVFMLSLAGIPPLAGFIAKYLVFAAAIQTGLVVLAIIGILSTVVGAYYYLRVVGVMFFSKETSPLKLEFSSIPAVGTALLVVLIILYGLFPSMLLDTLGIESLGVMTAGQ